MFDLNALLMYKPTPGFNCFRMAGIFTSQNMVVYHAYRAAPPNIHDNALASLNGVASDRRCQDASAEPCNVAGTAQCSLSFEKPQLE